MPDDVGTLSVELLPARHGDCILLTWGRGEHSHRILVDVGPAFAYRDIASRLRELDVHSLDLLVLTHVDADHVEGTIMAVNDKELGLNIGEVLFNGAPQLAHDELAPVHGEILGAIVAKRDLPWNTAFDGHAAVAPESGVLPKIPLCCGFSLTVLAPDAATLRALRDVWQRSLVDAELDFGDEEAALAALHARSTLRLEDSYLGQPPLPDIDGLARLRSGVDRKIPNASSIVLLAELGTRRVLLAGDSTPNVLHPALNRLIGERGPQILPLTAFKLAHHGSSKNISKEIIRLVPAEHYLFSSNGSYFGHPDDTSVATVIKYAPIGASLVFNYANPRTLKWQDDRLIADFKYQVRYPDTHDGSVRLTWTVNDD